MLVAGNKRIPSLTASDKWRFKMWLRIAYRISNTQNQSLTASREGGFLSRLDHGGQLTERTMGLGEEIDSPRPQCPLTLGACAKVKSNSAAWLNDFEREALPDLYVDHST